MTGHLLKECPLNQKVSEKQQFKMTKDNKKTIAAWSDSESSESESDEDHTTNIYGQRSTTQQRN